ncbi:MAG: WD40/YVTN/BNR-like repeat-containing protein [Candidatus Acidiferrales bacterium]
MKSVRFRGLCDVMRDMKGRILLFILLAALGGGAQWKQITVATKESFRGLSIVDASVIWVSGTNGAVIRTTDGGETWSVRTVAGAEKLDIRGIRAFDARTAVAMSSGKAEDGAARIYRTEDGGEKWQLVYEEKTPGIFFDAIGFWDRQHGIVLSDPVEGRFALFTTKDGGKNWKKIAPARMPRALAGEGAFAASNSCLTVEGESRVWFGTGGAASARVFRSADRGKTWEVAETPLHPQNASSGVFSVAFRDAKRGVAAGGDYGHPADSNLPNVMFTDDGGKTWRVGEETSPRGLYLSAVAYRPSSGDILAAGSAGMIFGALGRGWARVSEENINAIAYANDATSWAVGPRGFVAHKILQHPN